MADNDQAPGTAVVAARAGAEAALANSPLLPYVEGIARLPFTRQLGVIVGLAGSVAFAVWLVLWTQQADLRPLYGSLEHLDAPAVVNVLETNKIKYHIDQNSGVLLVDGRRMQEARLKLAEAGMPSDNVPGFELMDKEQGLGTSQFMETARFRRGLEGELARTIGSINGVRGARVHLAIPERSVFVRDQRRPSASVLLELVPGRVIDDGQVRGIGNLIASSVPELKLGDVTIVDQKGKLLSNFALDEDAVAASKQLDYTRRLEDQLVERVHRILDPIIGTGRYKAEVTADVDFTAVEQTDEIYNPDLPALRSEQMLDEQRGAGEAGAGIPGALSNQPPAAGAAPEVATAGDTAEGAPTPAAAPAPAAGRNVRTQSTRNFELDRTLSYTRHQVGRMRRVSVAVVLDDQLTLDAAGKKVSVPWDAAAVDRITTLVRDAVGFDAARGDSVNVVNAAFYNVPADAVELDIPIWEREWFIRYVPSLSQVIGGLFVLMVLFTVVLPVLRMLGNNAKQMRAIEERHRMERTMVEQTRQQQEKEAEPIMLPSPNRDYEKRLAAVQTIVGNDAEKVAQVVRKWVRENE
jgi:flagellar M-ring protein FliF